MAHPRLVQLVEDPEQIVAVPAEDIPRLRGDAEALKARLWARLQECSAPVAEAPPAQGGNGPHRLLTAGQAAERLDVTLARLYELARTGTLRAVRIGRQIRFSPDALGEWIASGGQPLAGGWRRQWNKASLSPPPRVAAFVRRPASRSGLPPPKTPDRSSTEPPYT